MGDREKADVLDVLESDEVDEPDTDEVDSDEVDEVDEKAAADAGYAPVRLREIVLLVVAVLGIVGTILFGLAWNDLKDAEDQRDEVEAAASDFLNALFEWDGTTIDADFDRILEFATGEFEQEAQATFNDDEIRQSLRENRAGSRMDELDTFTRSIDGDQARVFAVVDQTAANQEFPEGRADTVRVELGLEQVDGEWKVFDVNVIDGLSLGLPSVPDTGTGG